MKTLVLNRSAAGPNSTVACVLNVDGNTLELYDTIIGERYYPEQAGTTAEDVTNFMKDLHGDLLVRINSRGGDVGAALTMVNRLKDYSGGNVTTLVDGYAFSAAGVVAQAGKVRKICRGGIFMIHNPRMYPEIKSLEDLDSVKNNWLAHQSSILSIFEGRGVNIDKAKKLMEKETFLSAEDAVTAGFFDEVHDSAANYAALNLLPVENLPEEFRSRLRQPGGNAVTNALLARRLRAQRKTYGIK